MPDNVLRAIIKVDAPGINQTFQNVNLNIQQSIKQLDRLYIALNRATEPAQIKQYEIAISQLEGRIASMQAVSNASSISLGNIGKQAVSAKNFFGAFGVELSHGYNILRQIAYVIPGIGIGGIVAGAVSLLGTALFDTGEKAKKADNEFKSLADDLANQSVKLTSLTGIILNVNSAYSDKKKALQAINQEYGHYLQNLGIEKVTTDNLAESYNKVIDAILRQAVVKGIQEQISKAVEQTANSIIALQVAEEKRQLDQGKSIVLSKEEIEANNKKIEANKNLQENILGLHKPIQDGIIAQTQSNLVVRSSINNIGSLADRTEDLKAKLLLQLQPLLNVTKSFDDLNVKLNESKSKVDELKKELQFDPNVLEKLLSRKTIEGPSFSLNISDLENVQKNITSIEEQLGNLSKVKGILGVNLQPEIDKLNEELKLYKQIAAAIPANVPLTLKETTRLADITAIAQQIENALKGLPPVTIPVEVKARLTPKEFANYLTDLNSAFKNIQSVSRQALSGFFETIGNSIGDIVGGKNPFQAIFQFIGGIIQQFGKAIIDLGIVKKGLDIVLKNILTLPASAIIAIGVGAIAVGEILKNLGNNIPGRALGGPVGAGNTYIVGEKGPEIFVPSVSGTIIPNNQIGNVRAGNFGNFSGEVVFRIGNNELIGTLSKGYKNQSRLV